MSVVIIGGHDRMVSQYKKICKAHHCKAKVFTQMAANLAGQIGSPDLLYLKGYASAGGSYAGGDMAYRFSCWGSTVEYVYAADMFSLFPENDLTLSATDYGSAAEPVNRTPGDCNSDGKVNGMDLIRLCRYLVGDNVLLNLSNADVTGDGKVNGMDLVRLKRYMVGDNVVLK